MSAANRIFISYRHEEPWIDMARNFGRKLRNYRVEWKLQSFIDERDIVVGDPWRASVNGALANCSHFLCLLCDSYWESTECRRELDSALARRAQGQSVRVLFVLLEPMKPEYLSLNDEGKPIGDVSKVGDFHFLGPFDKNGRRVPLNQWAAQQWSDPIEEMLTRLERTLAKT